MSNNLIEKLFIPDFFHNEFSAIEQILLKNFLFWLNLQVFKKNFIIVIMTFVFVQNTIADFVDTFRNLDFFA